MKQNQIRLPLDHQAKRARNAPRQGEASRGRFHTNSEPVNAAAGSQLTDNRYERAPVSLLTLDRQSRIGELNESAARLLAFPRAWLINRTFLVFVAKHDVARFMRWLIESARIPKPRIIRLDLRIRDYLVPVQMSVATIVAPTGKAMLHQLAISDLSELKRPRSEVEESLFRVVQNAPDVMMTLDRSGKIVFANRPLWTFSVDALLKTSVFEIVPKAEGHKLKRCIERAFKSDVQSHCEIEMSAGSRQSWFTFTFGRAEKAVDGGKTSTLVIRESSDEKRGEEMLRASSEQMRHFAERIDLAREEERKRIARELHDDLGQALTILKLDLAWAQSKLQNSTDTYPKMQAMVDQVDEIIQRVRRISSELRPAMLDDLGLWPAIEWQASQIQERTGIKIVVSSDAETTELPNEAAVATFRVVQEALTNVVRHAEATKVRVRLKSARDTLRITIEDNGKGLTKKQVSSPTSFGIVGMKERISRLGGRLLIVSEPGKGTRLDFIIPVQQ